MPGPTLSPLAIANPVNRAHPLNRGRAVWWLPTPGRMGGTALQDLMGRAPVRSFGSPAWVADPPFSGLALDGSTQYLTTPRPAGTGPMTVLVRAKFANFSGATISANWGNGNKGSWIWNAIGGQIDVYDGYLNNVHTGTILTTGTWYDLAMTVGAGVTAYVDGVAVGTNKAQTTTYLDPTINVATFGGRIHDDQVTPMGYDLAGVIAEASIYDRALSAAEIAQLHDQRRRGYPDLLRRAASPIAFFVPPTAGWKWWAGGRSSVLGSGMA